MANLKSINDAHKQIILDVLDSIGNFMKHVVLDPDLFRQLSFVVPYDSDDLKERNVHCVYEMDSSSTVPHMDRVLRDGGDTEVPNDVIFLVHPSTASMKAVATEISNYELVAPATHTFTFHLYILPNGSKLCEHVLDELGVLDKLIVSEMDIGFVAIDDDLLSLEWPSAFREIYVDDDTSVLRSIALSLVSMQEQLGVIPNVRAKGTVCERVLRQAMNLRRQRQEVANNQIGLDGSLATVLSTVGTGSGAENGGLGDSADGNGFERHDADVEGTAAAKIVGLPSIDTLLVLDRDIDLISPLVTPLTYEGLLDELIGIETGYCELPSSVLVDSGSSTKVSDFGLDHLGGVANAENDKTRAMQERANETKHLKRRGTNVLMPLNAMADPTFGQIRTLSIEGLARILQAGVVRIQEAYVDVSNPFLLPLALALT